MMSDQECVVEDGIPAEDVHEVAAIPDTKSEEFTATKDEKISEGNCDEKLDDVYSYTKRENFTSENFKVEINNLPKYVSYVELKKMLKNKFKLKVQKIKLINANPKFAFVAFQSEEDRDAAIEKLNGFQYKGHSLSVKKANPAPDPLVKKRKSEAMEDGNRSHRREKRQKGGFNTDPSAINDQVARLWKHTYEEQLEIKKSACKNFMLDFFREIGRIDKRFDETCPKLFRWWKNIRKSETSICALREISPSPVTHGYRNKCEFSIGLDKTVGFRTGLYKDGDVTVISPPDDCPLLSPKMVRVIRLFEQYLKEVDSLAAFDNETHEGYWRQITLRTSEQDCVAIVALHPQKMDKEDISEVIGKIKEYFEEHDEKAVTSWYVHFLAFRDSVFPKESDLKLIAGGGNITEELNDGNLKLQISPFAFFQINKSGAEVLYKTIIDLAEISEDSVVLDVCCGTGTIGLYLAPKVKHVIGIELSKEAVKDCWCNAERNNLKNIEFIQGRAEDVIRQAIEKAKQISPSLTNLVCILDPPRAGLNNTIIKILRGTDAIKKIIYVSCEPKMAKRNLLDLCRPTSKAYQGSPFIPVAAAPVDMFPHTEHYELVLHYQRLDEYLSKQKPADDIPIPTPTQEVVTPEPIQAESVNSEPEKTSQS